jgi:cell wall-associated protease
MKQIIPAFFLFIPLVASPQNNNSSTIPINWQLMDWQQDGYPGISVEKAYSELLKNKRPLKKIIVAIIDCGMDDTHPDLSGMEWTNPKEIAGNHIDDDKNGFIDDVHGWNFIGDKPGDSINTVTLEAVREYVRLKNKYENKRDTSELQKDPQYTYWKTVVAEKEKLMSGWETSDKRRLSFLSSVKELQNYWSKKMGKDTLYVREVRNLHPDANADSALIKAYDRFMVRINGLANEGISIDSLALFEVQHNAESDVKEIEDLLYPATKIIEKNDAAFFRRNIANDDPYINTKMNYGNANTFPIADIRSHGTKIAGVIGALRNNNLGGNGITNAVELMIIKVSEGGDEWDKDVANSIRYAVDNGAQVINMSFGKTLSPQKKWVEQAMRYAEKKGVLLVAAAGNAHSDNDRASYYPIAYSTDKKIISNLVKVGASTYDSSLVARFSNYGKHSVDFFAPGVSIYTTTLHGKYATVEGTSSATPMVAGLAAIIWSYYPTLTYKQLKYCIEKSATPINILVTKPGTNEKVAFSSLSKTGGIVNAYKAVLIAQEIESGLPPPTRRALVR